MKKFLPFLFVLCSIGTHAQIFPDGTTINSFSATDINNNFFSSTIATNNGKHIIVDISATWCGICWSYHNTKVLDDYNAKYGPSGTDEQDAEVLFYEGDASTNNNDLNGVGTNTVGDWVTGTNYRIFNEANPSNVKSVFSASGSLGYPSVFVVCSDKKMYRMSTSINTVAAMRAFVNDKCGTTPLSTQTVQATAFDYEIYPNPTVGNVNVNLHLDKLNNVSYDLYGSLGQKVNGKRLNQQQGAVHIDLETSNLPKGIYLLHLEVGSEHILKKIIVQ